METKTHPFNASSSTTLHRNAEDERILMTLYLTHGAVQTTSVYLYRQVYLAWDGKYTPGGITSKTWLY